MSPAAAVATGASGVLSLTKIVSVSAFALSEPPALDTWMAAGPPKLIAAFSFVTVNVPAT